MHIATMKMKFLAPMALAGALLAALPGCVGTEDGHTTAGDPVSKDTITSRYERPAKQLAEVTRVVLNRNGKLLLDNVVDNSFKAVIDQHDVWVKVTDLDGKLTQVTVQARRKVGGDVELAAEISKQIGMELVAEGK